MKIEKAAVLTGDGPDTILLETDLPSACWPYTDNADLKLIAAAGSGATYVREHFGLEPLVINVRERRRDLEEIGPL